VLQVLDQRPSTGQGLFVSEISELPRKKRRPRPLRELDQTARHARLRLEREIYRPRLVPVLLRLPPGELQQIDDERRVAAYGPIPSRCAMTRMLIREALMFRRAGRSPPKPPKGAPLPPELKARLEL
jgi:hypothetical protein